jgi:hypothetical protein
MVFRLAPMSTGLRVFTWSLFPLPALLLCAGLSAPPPVRWVLLGTTVFVVLLYASVWLAWRPTAFELDARGLRIVWPLRRRSIDRADIQHGRIITSSEFRREYGFGVRVGAGGLWGGFGLLKTRRETFSMWISRTDRFVLVTLRGARPLLITPDEPERFVSSLLSS